MVALDPLLPPLKRHRLNAGDYQRLGKPGGLPPDLRFDLLDGEIIDMAPIGARHWAMVNRLDAYSEPQPNIAIDLTGLFG